MRSHVKNAMPNTESTSRTSAAKVEDQSISTAQAARMLGMSTTMLQRLVDQNVFQAWKTPGGHRRIDFDSVLDYQKRIQKNPQGCGYGHNDLYNVTFYCNWKHVTCKC